MLRARYLGRRLSQSAMHDAGRPLDLFDYPLTVAIPRLACPAVVTALDIQHELMPELFSSTERAYRRLFYATAIDQAAAVITISEFCKRRRRPARRRRRHVYVSHLAVDRELFSASGPDDEALLAGLGLPERFVVYPANLWPHKNHERLLEAMGMLADDDVHLLLTGQQYGRWETLRDLADRLGVGRRVRHLGLSPVTWFRRSIEARKESSSRASSRALGCLRWRRCRAAARSRSPSEGRSRRSWASTRSPSTR